MIAAGSERSGCAQRAEFHVQTASQVSGVGVATGPSVLSEASAENNSTHKALGPAELPIVEQSSAAMAVMLGSILGLLRFSLTAGEPLGRMMRGARRKKDGVLVLLP
jgi:hypothetical protein